MTKQPHNPQDIPGGNPVSTTAAPGTRSTPAPRKQRVRGCGVPATVWFTPHPDTQNDTSSKEDNDSAGTPGASPARGEYRQWATDEMVRQFTAAGEHYAIVRGTVDEYRRSQDAVVTRRRRASADGDPSLDAETDIRAGYDLVVVIASDDEFPDDEPDWDDLFDADGIPWNDHDGRPWRARRPDPLTVLVKGAKRMLADGGTLAVQLPRPHPHEGFDDGTGRVITDARRAGLAYLQHIALVDSFIDDDGLSPLVPEADLDAFWAARSRGLAVHARTHSDVLIFRKLGKANTLA